jgi:hypothetical protein
MARTHWSAKLTRPLTLRTGVTLVTLSDARDCLAQNFEAVAGSASLTRVLQLLFKAAETGSFVDCKAATDHLAVVLKSRAVS